MRLRFEMMRPRRLRPKLGVETAENSLQAALRDHADCLGRSYPSELSFSPFRELFSRRLT